MRSQRIATTLVAVVAYAALLCAASAQTPLPELRVEATDGGSVLHVRNSHTQPLTAFLIELVGYPGSAFSLWHDEPSEPIAAGAERAFPITNMTVGAVPEYVKMQAAIYTDGSTAGPSEKPAQLVERRRSRLVTMRELILKLEEAQSAGTPVDAVTAGINEWSEGLPEPTRRNRNSQEAINSAATRGILAGAIAQLKQDSMVELLARLRTEAQLLATSKPAL